MALLFIKELASSSIKQQEVWGKCLGFPHSEKIKNKNTTFLKLQMAGMKGIRKNYC